MSYTPYEQGYAARIRGEKFESNPYDKDATPYSLVHWNRGWLAAQKEVRV